VSQTHPAAAAARSMPKAAVLLLALALALTGAMAFSAAAPGTADARNFTAQAKKQCKKVKRKAAKRKCIRRTVQRLKKREAARKRALRQKGVVGVMTRNLYLGADLGPAIRSANLGEFIDANGEILRDVDTNSYPVRVKGLASEILRKNPDLVGLQEVSLWRTGAPGPPKVKPTNSPDEFTTKDVRYDYLNLLMRELNKGKSRYRVVKVTIEFDFEGPANFNTSIPGGEINGRLTMRDVIIAKTGKQIRTRNAQGGNYETFYGPSISGVDVPVDRGWNSVEVKVRNSPWFKFVNTHLEAFGDDKNRVVDCMTAPAPEFAGNQVSIRCSQAKELYEKVIGPSTLPVIATGDFNSDDDSVIDANCPSPSNTDGSLVGNNGGVCGDTFAYNALKSLGMANISTSDPMSCCLKSDILTADQGGRADFDHHIDHILTDRPGKVRMLNSSVTGLAPQNGFWNSDHAGVFSRVRVLP
jgi:hypothetical protein